MKRLHLRPQARRDLHSIRQYTRATWGIVQTKSYLRAIERAFIRIAENPEIGQSYSSETQTYRRMRAGLHVIFFRVISDAVLIVRVLHEKMNFDDHL